MTELEYLFQAVRRNILLARTDDIKERDKNLDKADKNIDELEKFYDYT